MDTFIQALIMSFREGLEAFLIIAMILRYLNTTKQSALKKSVWQGTFAGVVLSLGFGGLLYLLSTAVGNADQFAKMWESGVSLIALVLITTFIVWMVNHVENMTSYVQTQIKQHFSKIGIFLVALTMIIREGAEIALFSFAGEYSMIPVLVGVLGALLLTILIFYSLVKVNLKTIFNITLIYLILQAGYLFGYGIHEGLSALKDLSYIPKEHWILTKAFNLSETIFNHKTGAIGLPLHIMVGWYSKPEWIQITIQYLYTISIFGYWWHKIRSQSSIKFK